MPCHEPRLVSRNRLSIRIGTPVACTNTVAVSVARRRSDATTRSGENRASAGTANRAWFQPTSVRAESRWPCIRLEAL
jgi:hypothetical protein